MTKTERGDRKGRRGQLFLLRPKQMEEDGLSFMPPPRYRLGEHQPNSGIQKITPHLASDMPRIAEATVTEF